LITARGNALGEPRGAALPRREAGASRVAAPGETGAGYAATRGGQGGAAPPRWGGHRDARREGRGKGEGERERGIAHLGDPKSGDNRHRIT
jgi:hypothetical protein